MRAATTTRKLREKLRLLYGARGDEVADRILRKVAAFIRRRPRRLRAKEQHFDPRHRFSEHDCLLITYADSIRSRRRPLAALHDFLNGLPCSGVHILPFYPSTSDGGFAVKNYKKVDPHLGTWDDIRAIGEHRDVMFDEVFNHLSSKAHWFVHERRGSELYKNHFIKFKHKNDIPAEQLERIVRPRTTDLLTGFQTKHGRRYYWTTFSADQVDLNFKEPRVLLRIVDVLFRHLKNGATHLRLDAVNYLWKELGTSCSHLKKTHIVVQVLRNVLDLAAPSVTLVTETNVPHSENKTYLSTREAQMVYNFTLAPLGLHTFYTGETHHFTRWANRLKAPKGTAYFNFLPSHDGIGLRGAARVLPQKLVRRLVREAKQHGSLVSYRCAKGRRTPYELNCTWWNAVNNIHADEPDTLRVQRYLATWGIALALKGVPGVYIHGLLATPNDDEAVASTGVKRDINRGHVTTADARQQLEKEPTKGLLRMLAVRRRHNAFSPESAQRIHEHPGVIAIERRSPDEKVLALINVTAEEQDVSTLVKNGTNLLTRKRARATLPPYGVQWVKK